MIEAIFIGNELCDGRTLNTNQQNIAKQLYDSGFYLQQSTTVDDTYENLVALFKEKIGKSKVIITTGGLGPTEDDRTAAALADACNLKLIRHDNEVKKIETYFKKTNRNMPAANAKQADFPKGAKVIENPFGTAPGFYLHHQNTLIFCCPGVPKEVLPMIESSVITKIASIFPELQTTHKHYLFKCIGIGESHCQERLADLYPLPPGVDITFQAKLHEIQIRLTKQASVGTDIITPIFLKMKALLADVCFSTNETESLESVIIKLCCENKFKISLAESCTGGLLSHRLTSIPGASNVIDINIVTYSNNAKSKWLHIDSKIIDSHGAVSEVVVKKMAQNIHKLSNCTFSVSISGIAGPSGGCKQKPVGTVYFGICSPKSITTYHKWFNGTRDHVQQRAAYTALFYLYKEITHFIA